MFPAPSGPLCTRARGFAVSAREVPCPSCGPRLVEMASPVPSTPGPQSGIKFETPETSGSLGALSFSKTPAPATPGTPASTYHPVTGFQARPQAVGQQNRSTSPAKQVPLSFGRVLFQPTIISKWHSSILFNTDYADCFLTVQNECIPVHRAVVLAQSSYLRTVCSPDPKKVRCGDEDDRLV